MQFDVEIGGKVRRVEVGRRGDGRLDVTVDTRPFVVDARLLDRDRLSLLLEESGGTRSVDVAVSARPGGEGCTVTVDGHALEATLIDRFGRRHAGGASGGSGPQQIKAPMPGKVVRVLARPGDAVEPRQGLVVIEAMKMENELRASRAGRVTAVRITEGQSVEAGTLLVIVE